MATLKVEILSQEGALLKYEASLKVRSGNLSIQVEGPLADSPRTYDIVLGGCPKCAHPGIDSADTMDCSTCRLWTALDRAIALGEYVRKGKSPLSEDILRAKQAYNKAYAYALGVSLAVFMKELHKELLKATYVVPVPWGSIGESQVTYHHEKAIARAFAKATDMLFRDDFLQADSPERMVGKGYAERVELAQKKIHGKNIQLNGSNILVIDDILTTGSTLDRCAYELKRMGASTVTGLVLARTGNR
ncbi:MAG: ComF family protein [Candidatus Thorarchaeota archaeon]